MSEEKNTKYDRQRKTAYITIVVLGAVAAALAFWWTSLSALPKVVIPSNPLPRQNGFDTFARAGTMLQDDSKISYAMSKIHTGKDPIDRNYTLAEKEELLKENEPALALFREGLKQEYMTPSYRTMDALFPYLANDRKFAKIMTLEAQVRETKGDWKGALKSHLDAMEAGSKVKKGGVIIHSLVGVACQAIGQRGVYRLFDHLSQAEAKSAVARLIKIDKEDYPMSETFLQEKYCVQAGLTDIFQHHSSYQDFVKLLGDNGSRTDSKLQAVRFFFTDRKRLLTQYGKYMDVVSANSNLPYASRPPVPPLPNDSFLQMLLPVTSQARFPAERISVANKLLIVGLALKIYKDQHGKYPSKLIELVPGVLPSLPNDPFALSGTFQYRLDKKGYVLYSVGPDGKDDGGTPIEDKTRSFVKTPDSPQRYAPNAESVGDILLGTNVK